MYSSRLAFDSKCHTDLNELLTADLFLETNHKSSTKNSLLSSFLKWSTENPKLYFFMCCVNSNFKPILILIPEEESDCK